MFRNLFWLYFLCIAIVWSWQHRTRRGFFLAHGRLKYQNLYERKGLMSSCSRLESNGHGRTSTRLNANVQFDMDTAVDITPTKDGGVLKKMVNLGVGSLGYPLSNDTVIVKWKMYDRNYDLVHSSDVLSEPFDFVVDAQPTQVISAWEIAVKTMFQGEIAMLYIQPSYGFGAEGAEGIIAPNASMICELNLVEIIPAITRQYKSVGYNESITDELLDNIRSGKSPIAQNVMDNKPIEERKSDKQRKMFDPTKHKVDPNQRVTGKGQKFIWDENPSSMEVQIKLPESIKSKQDLEVDIRATKCSIRIKETGEVVVEGNWHGKIISKESSWAFLEAGSDYSAWFRGPRLFLTLQKAHGHQDIWANVIADPVDVGSDINELQ